MASMEKIDVIFTMGVNGENFYLWTDSYDFFFHRGLLARENARAETSPASARRSTSRSAGLTERPTLTSARPTAREW